MNTVYLLSKSESYPFDGLISLDFVTNEEEALALVKSYEWPGFEYRFDNEAKAIVSFNNEGRECYYYMVPLLKFVNR
jgi:hypothetical protein